MGQIDGGVRPNVVAPSSKAVVDVRVPTLADGQRIEAAIQGLRPTVPGTSIVVEGSMDVPPMEPTRRNQRLWEAAHEAGARLGLELEQGTAGGVSDGNTASQFTATLDGLGAVGDGAHAAFEYLDCQKLIERCTLLALLLTLPPSKRPAEGKPAPSIKRGSPGLTCPTRSPTVKRRVGHLPRASPEARPRAQGLPMVP